MFVELVLPLKELTTTGGAKILDSTATATIPAAAVAVTLGVCVRKDEFATDKYEAHEAMLLVSGVVAIVSAVRIDDGVLIIILFLSKGEGGGVNSVVVRAEND